MLAGGATGQHIDPVLRAVMEDFLIAQQTNAVSDANVADGALSPEKINGTALTESTVFSGDVSGTFNSIIVVGFYPANNPSNFTTAGEISDADFATETFVLSQGFITASQVPANEADPVFSGIGGKTTVYTQIFDLGITVTTTEWTLVQGVVTSIRTNGTEIP